MRRLVARASREARRSGERSALSGSNEEGRRGSVASFRRLDGSSSALERLCGGSASEYPVGLTESVPTSLRGLPRRCRREAPRPSGGGACEMYPRRRLTRHRDEGGGPAKGTET